MKKIIHLFSRTTTNQAIIKEIDGLRCIAILAVVLSHFNLQVVRLSGLDENFTYGNTLPLFLELCGNGVSIFFCISAFILSFPFIQYYLYNGNPVRLQQYYWRRIKRLEIPYLLVLVVLLLFRIIIQGEFWKTEMPHFFSSVFYSHNIIYGRRSTINPVAWTLEIEIQFYIVLPLLAKLFTIKKTIIRRSILLLIMFTSGVVYESNSNFLINAHLQYSILPYLPVFTLGMLLADLYFTYQEKLRGKNYVFDITGIIGFLIVVYFARSVEWYRQCIEYAGYSVLFISIFKGKILNTFFTNRYMMAIGMMCYSIYLIHYALIYFISEKITAYFLVYNYYYNLLIQGVLELPIVLVFCSVFYLLIEKPLAKK